MQSFWVQGLHNSHTFSLFTLEKQGLHCLRAMSKARLLRHIKVIAEGRPTFCSSLARRFARRFTLSLCRNLAGQSPSSNRARRRCNCRAASACCRSPNQIQPDSLTCSCLRCMCSQFRNKLTGNCSAPACWESISRIATSKASWQSQSRFIYQAFCWSSLYSYHLTE